MNSLLQGRRGWNLYESHYKASVCEKWKSCTQRRCNLISHPAGGQRCTGWSKIYCSGTIIIWTSQRACQIHNVNTPVKTILGPCQDSPESNCTQGDGQKRKQSQQTGLCASSLHFTNWDAGLKKCLTCWFDGFVGFWCLWWFWWARPEWGVGLRLDRSASR